MAHAKDADLIHTNEVVPGEEGEEIFVVTSTEMFRLLVSI